MSEAEYTALKRSQENDAASELFKFVLWANLPNELQQEIGRLCDLETLLHLRLTNRHAAEVSRGLFVGLFHDVFFLLTEYSVARLELLVSYPDIARAIRNITVLPSEGWAADSRTSWAQLDMHRHDDLLTKLLQAEKTFQASPELWNRLCQIFRHCVNLEGFAYDAFTFNVRGSRFSEGYDESRKDPNYLALNPEADHFIRTYFVNTFKWAEEAAEGQVAAALVAAGRVIYRFRECSFVADHWGKGEIRYFSSGLQGMTSQLKLQNLRSLHYWIEESTRENDDPIKTYAEVTVRHLDTLPHLTELCIQRTGHGTEDDLQCESVLAALWSLKNLRNLRVLVIYCWDLFKGPSATQGSMLRFFRERRSSLREVVLMGTGIGKMRQSILHCVLDELNLDFFGLHYDRAVEYIDENEKRVRVRTFAEESAYGIQDRSVPAMWNFWCNSYASVESDENVKEIVSKAIKEADKRALQVLLLCCGRVHCLNKLNFHRLCRSQEPCGRANEA